MDTIPVYRATNLTYTYGQTQVLKGITCMIHANERVAILGANGSGKSTLLKLFNFLIYPTGGTLYWNKTQLTSQTFARDEDEYEFRRKVGFVFQDPDVQLFSPTVYDDIAFGPIHLGFSHQEVIERVQWSMDTLHISHLATRSPFTLSGGEKKKVAIATVLAIRPSIWLLDEPTASLDPASQSTIIDLLNLLHHHGATIILATHDIVLLHELSDRVIVLSEEHTVVKDTTPGKLIRDTTFLTTHNLVHKHLQKRFDTTLAQIHVHTDFNAIGNPSQKRTGHHKSQSRSTT